MRITWRWSILARYLKDEQQNYLLIASSRISKLLQNSARCYVEHCKDVLELNPSNRYTHICCFFSIRTKTCKFFLITHKICCCQRTLSIQIFVKLFKMVVWFAETAICIRSGSIHFSMRSRAMLMLSCSIQFLVFCNFFSCGCFNCKFKESLQLRNGKSTKNP